MNPRSNIPTPLLSVPTRRAFLRRLAISSALLAGMSPGLGEGQVERKVRFGLIADVHQDVMPDCLERVKAFVMANGIQHVQINSASYWWLNAEAARRETFPPEVHHAHPYLTHVAAYREPLWALVTLDVDRGELLIEGRSTEWIGPDPWERGEQTTWTKEQLRPTIADRRIKRNGGVARPGRR